ncbi:hypothetical protein CUJ83_03405 [Methanocella sp. CWC-04]|uniref:4a-hydroxytetrahydrobiopterin dehydratase n=1 Tax=Methanooceanicella nereidis TaxID=2052831 RepID=A0AAP2W6F5_9EURY|nr:4a-hydroxytetrahydrobiopterin dehydratase [Methanocella sp. CWC-04]MCD1294041.1 hypothetical protein [Methanocella sp. CWC-04]
MTLADKKCAPCELGTPPMSRQWAEKLLNDLPGWGIDENGKLAKTYTFNNFMDAVHFLDKVAKIAEEEGHHPDMCVQNYNQLKLMSWTHASKGLTENDFIIAAKAERAFSGFQKELACAMP